jgi:hypothetical protein
MMLALYKGEQAQVSYCIQAAQLSCSWYSPQSVNKVKQYVCQQQQQGLCCQ